LHGTWSDSMIFSTAMHRLLPIGNAHDGHSFFGSFSQQLAQAV
jgi:hypothetical protein